MSFEKNILYIDAANLLLTSHDFNIKYELYWLLEYLKHKYSLSACVYFTGNFSFDKKLYEELISFGVEIVFKEIYREDKKTKANCDVEIAERITTDVLHKKVSKIILLSGDGDFYGLLSRAETSGCRVKVLGIVKEKTSRLYRDKNKFNLTYISQIVNSGVLLKRENLARPLARARLFPSHQSLTD